MPDVRLFYEILKRHIFVVILALYLYLLEFSKKLYFVVIYIGLDIDEKFSDFFALSYPFKYTCLKIFYIR